MGNSIRPPSGTCIPMPDYHLFQKLLDIGFDFPEPVVKSKQENDVVITVSNGNHIPSISRTLDEDDDYMVSCTIPPNYGLFTQSDRGDIKYLYLCDEDGKSIAYISWWNKHDCVKASISQCDEEVDVKGFELVDNKFKRIETDYVKYINILNLYYKKRYQCASQAFLDEIFKKIKEIEQKIPLNERKTYSKLKTRNIRNRNEAYMYMCDESYGEQFKY